MPRQRATDLVVRAHGQETLVLDRRTGTAHCLPPEVSRVWDACTGRNTLAEIASAAGVDEPVAASAVGQLMELDLVEVPAGIDRRKLLRRGGLVGAGVAAASIIQSVVAPQAALAASRTITFSVSPASACSTRSWPLTVTMTAWAPSQYDVTLTPINQPAVGIVTTTIVVGSNRTGSNMTVLNNVTSPYTFSVSVFNDQAPGRPLVKSIPSVTFTCPGPLSVDP